MIQYTGTEDVLLCSQYGGLSFSLRNPNMYIDLTISGTLFQYNGHSGHLLSDNALTGSMILYTYYDGLNLGLMTNMTI